MSKIPAASVTYTDVMPIIDQAVASGQGVRYRLPTYGDAVNFRQRCYKYRTILRQEATKRMGEIEGYIASIPEDSLILQIWGLDGQNYSSKAPPDKSLTHDVLIIYREVVGELLDLDGNPIDIDPEPIESEGLDLE